MITAAVASGAARAMLPIIAEAQDAASMVGIVWRMRVTCQTRAVRRHALMSLRNPHGAQRNIRELTRGAVVIIARTMPSAARRGECVLVTRGATRRRRKPRGAFTCVAATHPCRDSLSRHDVGQRDVVRLVMIVVAVASMILRRTFSCWLYTDRVGCFSHGAGTRGCAASFRYLNPATVRFAPQPRSMPVGGARPPSSGVWQTVRIATARAIELLKFSAAHRSYSSYPVAFAYQSPIRKSDSPIHKLK